jgi:dTDP-4-dehydrorhamnose reductase
MGRNAKDRPILILGGSGLLGRALVAETEGRRVPCVCPDRVELDLTDPGALSGRLAAFEAAAVINTVAFTDVTGAEAPERREAVWGLNRDLPRRLAVACAELGTPLVHISTDYVFDGRKSVPYVEEDPVAPLQEYGRSKLEGERCAREALPAVLIVRTSTLFGPRPAKTKLHFVDAILKRGRERGALELVRHPISSPTYAPDLARALLDLLDAGAEGTVHAANNGSCTRVELAAAALTFAGLADRVRIAERPAGESGPPRPEYSVLDTTRLARLTGKRPRPWVEALAEYLGQESVK